MTDFRRNKVAGRTAGSGASEFKIGFAAAAAFAYAVLLAIAAGADDVFILISKDGEGGVLQDLAERLFAQVTVSDFLRAAGIDSAEIAIAKVFYMKSGDGHGAFVAVGRRGDFFIDQIRKILLVIFLALAEKFGNGFGGNATCLAALIRAAADFDEGCDVLFPAVPEEGEGVREKCVGEGHFQYQFYVRDGADVADSLFEGFGVAVFPGETIDDFFAAGKISVGYQYHILSLQFFDMIFFG